MIYINNQILPEMNHNARSLSINISKKRPDLEFSEGLFTQAIPGYSIYVGRREDTSEGNIFFDISIFNNRRDGSRKTITAEQGTIESIDNGVVLHLERGQIHELMKDNQDYTKINFERYDVVVPIDNMSLQRKDIKSRGDREMTYSMMVKKISTLEEKRKDVLFRIKERVSKESSLTVSDFSSHELLLNDIVAFEKIVSDSLSISGDPKIMKSFSRRIKNLKRGIKNDYRLLNNYNNTRNRYLVELNKKFSIPFASMVFILVGAPLGIMARRGNFALSTTISLGFFIIYWAFLIAGEQLADRGTVSPSLSMWLPNILLGFLGLYLIYINSKDRKKISFEIFNLLFRKKEKNDS